MEEHFDSTSSAPGLVSLLLGVLHTHYICLPSLHHIIQLFPITSVNQSPPNSFHTHASKFAFPPSSSFVFGQL